MRQVFFEPARAAYFLKRLRPLWRREGVALWLVGEGPLARKVAAAAAKDGVKPRRDEVAAGEGRLPVIVLTETDGAALHALLLPFIGLADAIIVAPVTDWHFSKRPLFLVTIPKAGTHLLYELAAALGYAAGVELPEFPLPQTWYCLEYSNSHTAAPDFFVDTVRRSPFGNRHHKFPASPALFIYRHPLDILVSESHYYRHDGKSPFAGWFDGLDFSARAERLEGENWLLGPLRERLGQFLPWLDFPNVIKLSFEELVGVAGGGDDAAQLALIWSILLKLQAPGDPAEIAARVFNPASPTFREGKAGAYLRELPAALAAHFVRHNADILQLLGYEVGGGAVIPGRVEFFRHQALSFSKVDFDGMALTVEAGFLGCNLVRYRGCHYAVPVSAGEVRFEALPADILAVLPSAVGVAALKLRLLVDEGVLVERLGAMDRLAAVLRGRLQVAAFHAHWVAPSVPVLVETYRGFNIIVFGGRFYGVRQAVGVVDLTGAVGVLVGVWRLDDVVVAPSVVLLRDEIDEVSPARRVRRELAGVEVRLGDRVEAGAADVAAEFVRLREELLVRERDLRAVWEKRAERAADEAAAAQAGMAQRVDALAAALRSLAPSVEIRLFEALDDIRTAFATKLCEASRVSAILQAQALAAQADSLRSEFSTKLKEAEARIDEHEMNIAALKQTWPLRLAKRLRRLTGTKK